MRKLWGYIKAWFGQKTEAAKDPEVEIEQAISEARARDRELRNQAAKVVAHRMRVASELEEAGEDAAKTREMTKQALLKADAATTGGDVEEAARWTQAAQTMALKLQAADSNVGTLKNQLQIAETQADQAKQAVNQNALQLQEMAAKRMQLLGQLESAKMQENVNKAMEQLSASVGDDAPTLKEVEDKIQQRAAEASAKAEIHSATPDGAMLELEQSVNLSKADEKLDELRAELGLGPKPTVGTPEVVKEAPAELPQGEAAAEPAAAAESEAEPAGGQPPAQS